MKDNKQSKLSCHHQVPLLLIPSEDDHTWSTYDVMDNKFLELKQIIPYDKRFCGSSEGWLVTVNKDWTITLYRPYFFVKEGNSTIDTSIHLPCLFPPEVHNFDGEDDGIDDVDQLDDLMDDREEIYDYHVHKAIITADPLESRNECIVMVIFGQFCELAFIRLAKDKTWTRIDRRDYIHADDILHYDNHLHALSFRGDLVSIGITDSCISTLKVLPEFPTDNEAKTIKRYVINSYGGELLQVVRYFYFEESNGEIIGPRKTEKFKIFSLDFDKRKWNEINNLGDVALFLGDNSSISVLASDFVGCQPSCIYFTHDMDFVEGPIIFSIFDLGMYDVKSRSFKLHYSINSDAFGKMARRPPIWVVPKLNAY